MLDTLVLLVSSSKTLRNKEFHFHMKYSRIQTKEDILYSPDEHNLNSKTQQRTE
jgi:hypothetical protein